jgi:hypothetical protein
MPMLICHDASAVIDFCKKGNAGFAAGYPIEMEI